MIRFTNSTKGDITILPFPTVPAMGYVDAEITEEEFEAAIVNNPAARSHFTEDRLTLSNTPAAEAVVLADVDAEAAAKAAADAELAKTIAAAEADAAKAKK